MDIRRSSRFSIRSVVELAVYSILVPVFVGCVMGCQDGVSSRAPEEINWEAYTNDSISAHLASRKSVFVFVYSNLSPESLPALNGLNSSQLEQLCQRGEYGALLLKYDDWSDPGVRQIAKTVGFTKKPFIVFYSADVPPVALDPFSLKPLELATRADQTRGR